ncbi:MAG: CinA family nicotinamide mononucleotide deamidase-related protein [Verrucomicrobiales bacterium]|nr:CinA family nicotinamide mononucleotide deamidase-related protein [Verrucomicrobiales bacterium]
MRVELINTGTELLLGNTLNTHLVFLGEKLMAAGLRMARQVAIPDGNILRDVLVETFARTDIVLVTGGLGPTSDDTTRELVAEFFGVELREDAQVLAQVTAYLSGRGREITPNIRRQALVPEGAVVLPNAFGTAPGFYFSPRAVPGHPGLTCPHLFLLPGPPRELHPMYERSVEPMLRQFCQETPTAGKMRNFRLTGVGESLVADTVEAPLRQLGEDLEIGYCARIGEVVVRCIGTPAQLEGALHVVAAAFPQQFFSDADEPLEKVVIDLLTTFGRTVSTAESCTGGFISHRLTNVPGASAVFPQARITYANEAKRDLLGVPQAMLDAHGAVSAEVCAAMAGGCLERSSTDHALAVTGIAGPSGGSAQKPVGTVFVGLASKTGAPVVERHQFPFERESFKFAASQAALDLLRRRLVGLV